MDVEALEAGRRRPLTDLCCCALLGTPTADFLVGVAPSDTLGLGALGVAFSGLLRADEEVE